MLLDRVGVSKASTDFADYTDRSEPQAAEGRHEVRSKVREKDRLPFLAVFLPDFAPHFCRRSSTGGAARCSLGRTRSTHSLESVKSAKAVDEFSYAFCGPGDL